MNRRRAPAGSERGCDPSEPLAAMLIGSLPLDRLAESDADLTTHAPD